MRRPFLAKSLRDMREHDLVAWEGSAFVIAGLKDLYILYGELAHSDASEKAAELQREIFRILGGISPRSLQGHRIVIP